MTREASEVTTASVNHSISSLQTVTREASDATTTSIGRSIMDLQAVTREASEAATASVNHSINNLQLVTRETSDATATNVNQSINSLQTVTREASNLATMSITRSIKDLQAVAREASDATTATINRAIKDLQSSSLEVSTAALVGRTHAARPARQTKAAVEQSKSTAAAAVSEMLETHGMLRSDTTALFERLREANILLQEVLSGAHENMNEIEQTLVNRVADFVTAMNEVAQQTGTANNEVEQHINAFRDMTARRSPTCRSLRPSSTRTAARWPRRSR